ncbi:Zinc finger CCHC-type and RNA-binding motif-containing protein 1 [Heterocephalus glaber]|uniref:Zinc finger CCHC-type and RNA-binding motif-containing protein 1 n=1 Tax=Heterocephalus glaber TaxID=10181 RepID=G5BTE5_HETGA|nr:Zinc finger CCHC-type and RNA-binding motif-containing protein 1 [Heterocephalus glaber]
MLGEREPPKKKEKKKEKKTAKPEEIEDAAESEDEGEEPALDSLSQAIASQEAKTEEQNQWKPSAAGPSTSEDSRRPRIKKSSYFVMRKKIAEPEEIEDVAESEDLALDSLSQAIASQQAKIEEQNQWKPSAAGPSTSEDSRRPRIKKSSYFSDEEEFSD